MLMNLGKGLKQPCLKERNVASLHSAGDPTILTTWAHELEREFAHASVHSKQRALVR